MSMSVGASASGALSYLESMLQQATSGAGGATSGADASDPISVLLKSLSGSATQAGAAVESAVTGAAKSCSRFSSDTLGSLISIQGQSGSSGAGSSSVTAGSGDASADSSTDADGATTVTTTNADGSTTTTTTYADGVELAATIPAAPSSGSSGGGSTDNASNPQAGADQFAQWLETQAATLLPAAGALLALV